MEILHEKMNKQKGFVLIPLILVVIIIAGAAGGLYLTKSKWLPYVKPLVVQPQSRSSSQEVLSQNKESEKKGIYNDWEHGVEIKYNPTWQIRVSTDMNNLGLVNLCKDDCITSSTIDFYKVDLMFGFSNIGSSSVGYGASASKKVTSENFGTLCAKSFGYNQKFLGPGIVESKNDYKVCHLVATEEGKKLTGNDVFYIMNDSKQTMVSMSRFSTSKLSDAELNEIISTLTFSSQKEPLRVFPPKDARFGSDLEDEKLSIGSQARIYWKSPKIGTTAAIFLKSDKGYEWEILHVISIEDVHGFDSGSWNVGQGNPTTPETPEKILPGTYAIGICEIVRNSAECQPDYLHSGFSPVEIVAHNVATNTFAKFTFPNDNAVFKLGDKVHITWNAGNIEQGLEFLLNIVNTTQSKDKGGYFVAYDKRAYDLFIDPKTNIWIPGESYKIILKIGNKAYDESKNFIISK